MPYLYKSGKQYGVANINIIGKASQELTQAQYNALSDAQKKDGTIYFVTDGAPDAVIVDDPAPIGAIMPYGGDTAPTGWLICDGSPVSRTVYSQLFEVIGETYGAGDGSTTFNVPDLKGRVAIGVDIDEDYGLGDTGGEEEHTLTIDEMPSHTHDAYMEYGASANTSFPPYDGQSGTYNQWGQYLRTNKVVAKGGDQAHNNMQPYVVTNYIIKAFDNSTSDSTLQSMTDYFYPVGSYYETSDSTFDPNVTFGGTWIMEGVVDDYIVDEGVDGIWMYKKWASGFSECFGTHDAVLSHYASSGGFYGYYTTVSFPSGLFYNRPVAVYNCLVDSAFSMAAANLNVHKDGMNLYALSNASGSQNTVWDIKVKGRWKELSINNHYRWHRTA